MVKGIAGSIQQYEHDKQEPLLKPLNIDDWKGEAARADEVIERTQLWYEPGAGYIYCPNHKDFSSIIMADTIAMVDDYGNIHTIAPGCEYRLQKEWDGFRILRPIEFCCKLWANHNKNDKALYVSGIVAQYEQRRQQMTEVMNQQSVQITDLDSLLEQYKELFEKKTVIIAEQQDQLAQLTMMVEELQDQINGNNDVIRGIVSASKMPGQLVLTDQSQGHLLAYGAPVFEVPEHGFLTTEQTLDNDSQVNLQWSVEPDTTIDTPDEEIDPNWDTDTE